MRAVGNSCVAFAHSKQQRGFLPIRVVCVTCTRGPGDVEDKCPGAGELFGHFSPRAFL